MIVQPIDLRASSSLCSDYVKFYQQKIKVRCSSPRSDLSNYSSGLEVADTLESSAETKSAHMRIAGLKSLDITGLE